MCDDLEATKAELRANGARFEGELQQANRAASYPGKRVAA